MAVNASTGSQDLRLTVVPRRPGMKFHHRDTEFTKAIRQIGEIKRYQFRLRKGSRLCFPGLSSWITVLMTSSNNP